MITSNKTIAENSNLAEGLKVIRQKPEDAQKKKVTKVAAYCRVSTDKEEQDVSIELQMRTYRKIISEHPDWELAGIYADPGVTGTSVKNRKEFLRMIEDAKAGKIDMILAKSTSRIARNTEDMLKYTRMLRDIDVGIYFEKEGINTLDMGSEMMLSIYAAFSQEESHDTSESVKLAARNRFKLGTPQFHRIYGFRNRGNNEMVVMPEEAQNVRMIFNLARRGTGMNEIVSILNAENIPSKSGNKATWQPISVARTLRNEKYMGDFRMQKTYVTDHLTHKVVENKDAVIPQYYKKNHHPAIVSREEFDEVQTILRLKDKRQGAIQYPYYGFLTCPFCGAPLVSCMIHGVTDAKVWVCSGKGEAETWKERTDCCPYAFNESVLNRTLNELIMQLKVQDAGLKTKLKEIQNMIAENPDKVERYFLTTLVEKITFEGWNTIKVTWKNGETSTAPMVYESVFEHPYPEEDHAGEGWPTVGGIPVIPTYLHRTRKGLQSRRDQIRNIRIQMTETENGQLFPSVKGRVRN